MHGLILLLLVIDALLLCLVVLLQAGKGSGLAAEFGGASSSTDSFLGGRQLGFVVYAFQTGDTGSGVGCGCSTSSL